MQSTQSVSVVIITYQRQAEVIRSIESIATVAQKELAWQEPDGSRLRIDRIVVVDNGSVPEISFENELVSRLALCRIELKRIRSNENLGVSGGRNLGGMHSVKSDWILFLDDDAILETLPESTLNNLEVKPALIAAQIKRHPETSGAESVRREIPWRGRKKRQQSGAIEVGYFVGAGFMVKRTVFESLKGFDESFKYGFEEVEFATRLMTQGFDLIYAQDFSVVHIPSVSGRIPTKQRLVHELSNRLTITRACSPRNSWILGTPFLLWHWATNGFYSPRVWRDSIADSSKRNSRIERPTARDLVSQIKAGGRPFF